MTDSADVLTRLASAQNRRDDIPNQELAREIAEKKNRAAVHVLADNLRNKDRKIQSDCIKTLYETGYIDSDLIKDCAEDFMKILTSPNNRLVWGGMTALSVIADKCAKLVCDNFDYLTGIINKGSVITVDAGIKALALAASMKSEYNKKIFPYLISHLKKCRPKEVAQHSESVFPAVNDSNKDEYLQTLNKREDDLSPSQISRLGKIYRKLQ